MTLILILHCFEQHPGWSPMFLLRSEPWRGEQVSQRLYHGNLFTHLPCNHGTVSTAGALQPVNPQVPDHMMLCSHVPSTPHLCRWLVFTCLDFISEDVKNDSTIQCFSCPPMAWHSSIRKIVLPMLSAQVLSSTAGVLGLANFRLAYDWGP